MPFIRRLLDQDDSHILTIIADSQEAAAEIAAPALPADQRALWIEVGMPDREWPYSFWMHAAMWGKDCTDETRVEARKALEVLAMLKAPITLEECGDDVTIQIDTDDKVMATKLMVALNSYDFTKRTPDWS